MAFSIARGGSIQSYAHDVNQLAVHPPTGRAEIMIEKDNQDPEAWYVSLAKTGFINAQQAPVYFPSVKTQEALLGVLTKAWDFHLQTQPPAPFLTRCIERTADGFELVDAESSSSPQTALPLRRRTDTLRQTTPRPG
jgi:hypothetical protein